ncbi:MAG: hypothetical protein PHV34_08880 [Verrucomicrobiae bacterium]|nr:hypothetical protein [Verrucomicrobiae bacterium]
MPKFLATLCFTQLSKATVAITARDERAATRKANEVNAADVENWDLFDGHVDVVSVERVKEDKNAGGTRWKSSRRSKRKGEE